MRRRSRYTTGQPYNETAYMGSLDGQSAPCGVAETSPSGSGKDTQYSSYQFGGFVDSVVCEIPGPILETCTKNEASLSRSSTTSSTRFSFPLPEVLLTFLSTFDSFHLIFGPVVGLFVGFLLAQSYLVGYVFHAPPFTRLGKG